MEKDHINPLKVPVFNDVDCSLGFATSQVRMIPCLTAKRGSTCGIWVSTRGRRIDLEEMFRFQGINSADVDWKGAGVTASQMGRMLGNAMSLNVCERVLKNLLWSAGLIERLVDRWAENTVVLS